MKYAFISTLMPERCAKLVSDAGFSVIKLPPYEKLPRPVASHPDMLMFVREDTVYTFGGYYMQNKELFDPLPIKFKCVKEEPTDVYPKDILLNAFAVGGELYGKLRNISEDVRVLFERSRNIKQGYASCSVCVIDGKYAVTADKGIYSALLDSGHDSLLISCGDIILPGYGYGFIGGASFAPGDGSVIFFGDISLHKDGEKIKSFADGHGVKIICSDGPLRDFGGVKTVTANGIRPR